MAGQGSDETPFIEHDIAAKAAVPRGVRFYLDYGTGKSDMLLKQDQKKVSDWLVSQGLMEGKDFILHEFPGAEHNEAAWRARLDEPLIFLFGNSANSASVSSTVTTNK